MVDDGLARYIRERLGEGYSEEEIRDALLKNGNDNHAIDEAFRSSRPNHHLLLSLVVLLLIVIAASLFLFLRSHAVVPAENMTLTPSQPEPTTPTTDVVLRAEELSKQAQVLSPDEIYRSTVEAGLTEASSVADGILLCSVNADVMYKNYCLEELAKQATEPRYCAVIGDLRERDTCYLQLIFGGEDQYCEKLILEESKRVCAALLR